MAGTPELVVYQSGEGFIKSHNLETSTVVPQKCLTCWVKGDPCSGMDSQTGLAKLGSNLSERKIKKIISTATCKPRDWRDNVNPQSH